ncbi:MAG: FUSC family protein [Christensenellales bacterium]
MHFYLLMPADRAGFAKGTMFYATIAAVVCTQQTHEKTVNMGLHRMLGTLIGGAVGYVVLVGLFACLQM